MSTKKYFLPMLISAAIFVTAASSCPVYAEDGSNSEGGFFSGIGKFFGRMFGGEDNSKSAASSKPQQMERKQNNNQPDGANQKMMAPKEGTAGGKIVVPGEVGRLNELVIKGKITEAQKTAILAKLKSVQDELKTWATAQGIDPQYVMMPGQNPMDNKTKEGTQGGMMKPGTRPMPNNEDTKSGDQKRMMQPNGQPGR